MRSDIIPGGTFPDYELPDQDRVTRRLSEIQGDDPLILTLARGNYCRKSTSSTSSWPPTTPRSTSPTPRSSPSPPTTITRCRSSATR